MTKIKILYRKNLKMSEGKIAAQSVHAALGLAKGNPVAADPMLSVVVLGVSDAKFHSFDGYAYWVTDAGYTEVEPGTVTCLAYLEEVV